MGLWSDAFSIGPADARKTSHDGTPRDPLPRRLGRASRPTATQRRRSGADYAWRTCREGRAPRRGRRPAHPESNPTWCRRADLQRRSLSAQSERKIRKVFGDLPEGQLDVHLFELRLPGSSVTPSGGGDSLALEVNRPSMIGTATLIIRVKTRNPAEKMPAATKSSVSDNR
jgi:hypothetical protein